MHHVLEWRFSGKLRPDAPAEPAWIMFGRGKCRIDFGHESRALNLPGDKSE